MKTYDQIVACLRRAADTAGGKSELLRFLGAKKATFYRAMDDDNPSLPSPEVLCEWLDKLHISFVPPGEEMKQFELVPRVRAVAGAGESLETDDHIDGYYAFRDDFFRKNGIHPKKCAMLLVRGDSMEPLIRDGDFILVDQGDNDPQDGLIYLLGVAGALMVKRLFRLPTGWRLYSENRSYSPIDLQGDELDSFRVFGRVRWFGRVL